MHTTIVEGHVSFVRYLLVVLDELEAYEVFVEHFDDIQGGTADAVEDDRDDGGLIGRLLSWIG